MTWIDPVIANPAKCNSFNSFPKLLCLNCHPPTPVCVTEPELSQLLPEADYRDTSQRSNLILHEGKRISLEKESDASRARREGYEAQGQLSSSDFRG